MKSLTIFFTLFISTAAHADFYLRSCYDMEMRGGVSYSYQNCINSNFSLIQRNSDIFISHCTNYGRNVSFSYTSCIERNFSRIQNEIPDVYLRYCSNFDRKKLGLSYQSCVRSNFVKIENELNLEMKN